jgi:hypothetical protein
MWESCSSATRPIPRDATPAVGHSCSCDPATGWCFGVRFRGANHSGFLSSGDGAEKTGKSPRPLPCSLQKRPCYGAYSSLLIRGPREPESARSHCEHWHISGRGLGAGPVSENLPCIFSRLFFRQESRVRIRPRRRLACATPQFATQLGVPAPQTETDGEKSGNFPCSVSRSEQFTVRVRAKCADMRAFRRGIREPTVRTRMNGAPGRI